MASREQQRDRLNELSSQWGLAPGESRSYPDFLLDNGVTVDVPEPELTIEVKRGTEPVSALGIVEEFDRAAPTYRPGDVAIATVRGAKGVRVFRADLDQHVGWRTAEYVDGELWFHDDEVTVTSRAVVVTEADADELAARVSEATAGYGAGPDLIREWFDTRLGGGA